MSFPTCRGLLSVVLSISGTDCCIQFTSLPGGWAIPIGALVRAIYDKGARRMLISIPGVLFVLSFPPLFGHEIVAVICGLVWGIWIGFAIVAAGELIEFSTRNYF